jgi:CheY-like chemotaxis protein
MDEAVLEQAFEPFFTTRQPAQGRGLGLSLVFGQVVGQGGALLIDSAPGAGTTVRLLWPAPPAVAEPRAEAGAAGSEARPPRRALPKGQGQRVLVAEDDRVLREALGEMLQRLGYKPVLVNDGEVARRVLVEGGAVEAVLTDRRMPNLSGTELIDWMRAEGLRQPVLLCTGYGEDLDIASLTRAGGVVVLSKPIDAATLARSLEEVLAAPVA